MSMAGWEERVMVQQFIYIYRECLAREIGHNKVSNDCEEVAIIYDWNEMFLDSIPTRMGAYIKLIYSNSI